MNKYQVTDTSVCRVVVNCLLTFITATLLISNCVTADDIIPQSPLPEVYLPEDCKIVHLNGFSKAVIVSQKSDRYAPNYLCKVLITLHGDYLINFVFEKLDLPDPSSDGRCSDSVQLFNVIGQSNVQMTDKICGSKRPSIQLLSNSSSAMLVFSSDSYQEKTGFRLRYERVQNKNSQPETGAAVGGCSPGTCLTSSASSTRLERSLQQSTVILLVSLVSMIVYRYSGR